MEAEANHKVAQVNLDAAKIEVRFREAFGRSQRSLDGYVYTMMSHGALRRQALSLANAGHNCLTAHVPRLFVARPRSNSPRSSSSSRTSSRQGSRQLSSRTSTDATLQWRWSTRSQRVRSALPVMRASSLHS